MDESTTSDVRVAFQEEVDQLTQALAALRQWATDRDIGESRIEALDLAINVLRAI